MSEQIPDETDARKVRIPRLPFTDETRNLRMLVVDVFALVARTREDWFWIRRFDDFVLTLGYEPERAAEQIKAERTNGERPEVQVWSVRYYLEHPPFVVAGIEIDLSDVGRHLTDEDIRTALDAWSRPPGRPRNGAVRESRWEHLSRILRKAGLAAEPSTLKDDWSAWTSSLTSR